LKIILFKYFYLFKQEKDMKQNKLNDRVKYEENINNHHFISNVFKIWFAIL